MSQIEPTTPSPALTKEQRDAIQAQSDHIIRTPLTDSGSTERAYRAISALWNDACDEIDRQRAELASLRERAETAEAALNWHPVSEIPSYADEHTVWVGGGERGALFTHRGGQGFGWFVYDAGADDLVMIWPTHWRGMTPDPNKVAALPATPAEPEATANEM